MTATRLFARAVIRLSPQEDGEEIANFLQGLVTNDVTGALPVWAGLLSAQGKGLFDFLVWRDGTDLLLDCEADAAEALIRRMGLYRLRRRIAIALDPALAVHWSAAPQAGAVPDPRLAALGWRWLAPATPDDASADEAWRTHRLELGVAEGRAELGDGELLWLECNADQLHGVSFTKGCYVGQENTARMNWRQKINRRLVVVPITRSNPGRQRAAWPELGMALDHLRVEDIATDLRPEWMAL
jgi:folate-binding protein YgfZ